ncbi:uncharacterized protein PAC_08707 [Phialocephala subalpina]|uniref:Protein kinase domain-containing protein n=1 Tax=Phialocephala subalpina TaxID=576137 RepID=A0A1L7X1C2_9HELO|nr:uncharacterized protein PAC_08707 [Phialocephala subalpina]
MAKSLYKMLNSAKVQCRLTYNRYIPWNCIDQFITWPLVELELLPHTPALQKRNVENILQRAKRVIAIVALITHKDAIERLLLELLFDGLTDDDLPLSLKGGNEDSYDDDGTILESLGSKKVFKSFATWDEQDLDRFLETQWMVIRPPLRLDDDTPANIQVDKLLPLGSAFASWTKIDKNSNTAHVYKVELSLDHKLGLKDKVVRNSQPSSSCTDNCMQPNPRPSYVAIKIFEPKISDALQKSSFDTEREVLDKIISKHILNDHLIRHLATCEQLQCIIFPWADGGDLADFWKRERECSTPYDFIWSIGQMVGLAHALKDLHEGNIRHGDMKPVNILLFRENGVFKLKIADVGISRAHTKDTCDRTGGTKTSASTRFYEGPEVLSTNSPMSRLYDCWSMGCIILEFVVWMAYGSTALENFWHSWDLEQERRYYRLRVGTSSQSTNPREKAEVHSNVLRAIRCLRNDPRYPGTALEALVDIVDKHLLQINPEARLSAADLHKRLQGILDNTGSGSLRQLNIGALRPSIPEIFNRPPRIISTIEQRVREAQCVQPV